MPITRVVVTEVERLEGYPKSVTLNVIGTYLKFVRVHGIMYEAARYRESQVLDRDNFFIAKVDYAKAVKQAAAILSEA